MADVTDPSALDLPSSRMGTPSTGLLATGLLLIVVAAGALVWAWPRASRVGDLRTDVAEVRMSVARIVGANEDLALSIETRREVLESEKVRLESAERKRAAAEEEIRRLDRQIEAVRDRLADQRAAAAAEAAAAAAAEEAPVTPVAPALPTAPPIHPRPIPCPLCGDEGNH